MNQKAARPCTSSTSGNISTRWGDISLQYVSLKLPSKKRIAGPASLRLFIESQLSSVGRPVRWAIVKADSDLLTVEAVVSCMPTEDEAPSLYTDDSEGRSSESKSTKLDKS